MSVGRPVRQRFTALYAALFAASGAVLLLITNVLAAGRVTEPAPDRPPTGPDLARQWQAGLLDAQAAQQRQLLVGSLIALLVMAVVSVVLGRFVAGRVLRPLRAITTATRRISADNLHERLAVPGPADEVKDLADTVDELLARLETSFAAQRRFVANASHELRTPLTTMRASLDVAAAKPDASPGVLALADRVRAELDRTDLLLDGLLALARAHHGVLPDRTTVPLHALVSDAVAGRAREAADRDLTVRAEPVAEAWVDGSPTLLARLVDNLVDNAIVHNERGGWLAVRTASAPPTLVVETGGPVLDPRRTADLGEPFRRLATTRTGSDTGSGLGLSIVRAVVEAHGGTLDLHARSGGGLRATVTLPPAGVVAG